MNYPNKNLVIDTLLEAARDAAEKSSANHPEDLAAEMVGALDGAVSALVYLHKEELLRRPAYWGGFAAGGLIDSLHINGA